MTILGLNIRNDRDFVFIDILHTCCTILRVQCSILYVIVVGCTGKLHCRIPVHKVIKVCNNNVNFRAYGFKLFLLVCITTIACMFVSENEFGREVPKNEQLIESDEDPHINVGSHFQANVESFQKSSHPGKIQSHEDLVWEPAIKHGVMDNEGKNLKSIHLFWLIITCCTRWFHYNSHLMHVSLLLKR